MKNKYPMPSLPPGTLPTLFNRPSNGRFFYNISLRKKNGVKLTKVNNFSYNELVINNLLLNNNIFQAITFSPFSGYLRQYLTTLSDSGLNETIEKKINTELILPSSPAVRVPPVALAEEQAASEGGSPSARKISPPVARVLKNICEIFADYQLVINKDEKFLMIFLAQTGVNYTFAVPKKIVVGALTAEIQAQQAIKSKFNIQNETP